MTNEELKDELIDCQTIQVALNDKLHRYETILVKLKNKIYLFTK